MRYVVGVMGPAKARRKDIENARALGELIARREWVLLTGGRDVGVMHAANQGAKKVPRSLTVGVLPTTRDKISKYVDDVSKLQVENRAQATVQALKRGLVSLEELE